MGPFSPPRAESSLVPHFIRRTRRVWEDLSRPVTLPETTDEWQSLLSGMGPLPGPFDWSLSLGPMREGKRGRHSRLGSIVNAWQHYGYDEARQACARLALELAKRAQAQLEFDLWAELPHGFESGEPLSFAALFPEPVCADLWERAWASSYDTLPAQADVWDHALRLRVPVAGKRVLLSTPVFDRPELASGCVHLLKAHGATWVGLLALASDTPHE